MEKKDFGKRLMAVRREKGLSRKQVGAALGLAFRSYMQYEQGVRMPNIFKLVILADLLDVSTDFLLGREVS